METQATENIKTVETPNIEGKKSRLAASLAYLQSTPKWAQIAVPALLVALGGYGYLHQQGLKGSQNDSVTRQSPVAGPYGVPLTQAAAAPADQLASAAPGAHAPYQGPYHGSYYGPYYGSHYGSAYDGYGRGNGYGHGRGYGHGNGRMNASFSFGGNMSGGGNGYGDGYGYGNGNGNGYGNGYGNGRNGGWW